MNLALISFELDGACLGLSDAHCYPRENASSSGRAGSRLLSARRHDR
jgi:hypothetical protein